MKKKIITFEITYEDKYYITNDIINTSVCNAMRALGASAHCNVTDIKMDWK